MKIFEKDSKVNFVDTNNVLVGYDMNQCCCENADWFISDSVPMNQEEPSVNECGVFYASMKHIFELDDTVFDQHWKEPNGAGLTGLDNGGSRTFRIVNERNGFECYLTLFNCHNGYYSHGFTVEVGGRTIEEGYL